MRLLEKSYTLRLMGVYASGGKVGGQEWAVTVNANEMADSVAAPGEEPVKIVGTRE